MAKVDMWMPLYIADYLADTAYLTTEQSGAYLHLLMAYWRNGPPPDNDSILSTITKLSPDAWSIARAVLEPFFDVADGAWIHKRVEQEITKASKNRNSAHERAVKAAAARWAGKENAPSMREALPEDILKQCPSPSPSPSPIQSPPPPPISTASRKKPSISRPDGWKPNSRHIEKAAELGLDIQEQLTKFTDWADSKAMKYADWDAGFRTWLGNAPGFSRTNNPFQTAGQRRQAVTDESIRLFLATDTDGTQGAIDHDPR